MSEEIVVKKQTLTQEDFIDWILKNTDDLKSEFRVYQTKYHIMVGIDEPADLTS